jgi:tRNA (cytidine56-2'-O)-methyltransferase
MRRISKQSLFGFTIYAKIAGDAWLKRIVVLRMGHRKKRDPRLSTHVALAARAFGASEMVLSGECDQQLIKSISKAVLNWGGTFAVRYVKSWRSFMNEWKTSGKVVHLTMYGEDIRRIIDDVRECDNDLLVVVGSQKVPRELYELADWNISITNQPHSEVSALAVFLHMLTKEKEFDLEFERPKIRILPSKRKKRVLSVAPRHPSS